MAAPTIVTTALARTDRRALPEAWYAALHLAHDAPPVAARHGAAAAMRHPAAHVPLRSEHAARQAAAAGVPGAARTGSAARVTLPERRAIAGVLARKLEHGIARAVTRRAPSAFTIALADGRVRVVVRTIGDRTSVVALCAPALRERVERALAHARFALAARGLRTEAA